MKFKALVLIAFLSIFSVNISYADYFGNVENSCSGDFDQNGIVDVWDFAAIPDPPENLSKWHKNKWIESRQNKVKSDIGRNDCMQYYRERQFTPRNYVTYFGDVGATVQVEWDDPMADGLPWTRTALIELKIYNIQRDEEIIINDSILAGQGRYRFEIPKVGHWIASIRVKALDEFNKMLYSDWIDSTDELHSTVKGVPGGWWIFTWLARPGVIDMELNTLTQGVK